MKTRIQRLIDFCQGIGSNASGKELYSTYLKDIESIQPQELFLVMNEQLKMGVTVAEALTYVDKLVNVFHKPLSGYAWKRPSKGTFLYYLRLENDGIEQVLESMRILLKKRDYQATKIALLEQAKMMSVYNAHLLKLENILFPYMEKKNDRFDGLKIMWSLHDQARVELKGLIRLMEEDSVSEKSIYVVMGDVFFTYSGLVQKQELIMFPAATELFTEEEFRAMHEQSFDYEFSYIDAPNLDPLADASVDFKEVISGQIIHTATGHLTFEQVELLINTLPVDVTLVDEHDKVAFFSRPKDRIFPRSVAIIGRDVRNCHPPESVHVVMDIIQSFRDGSKSDATFWIQMKGLFILIQYFALRDASGTYKGTLEVSQEISEIRKMDGQKRLLDWA